MTWQLFLVLGVVYHESPAEYRIPYYEYLILTILNLYFQL